MPRNSILSWRISLAHLKPDSIACGYNEQVTRNAESSYHTATSIVPRGWYGNVLLAVPRLPTPIDNSY